MIVYDWMTIKVFSARPDDRLSEAVRIMKEMKITHIPVVRDGKIVGMVTDRDIKEFSPSKAKSHDVYDLHIVLEKTRIKEVMKKPVHTATPDMPIEEAAMLMYDENISCLPVEKDDLLSGIITKRDIFRAMIDITGVRYGGHRVWLKIDDSPRGAIKEIADTIRRHGFGIQSILTSYEKVEKGYRNVVIRTKGAGSFGALKAELMGSYNVVKMKKG